MKDSIYTIPISEVFEPKDGCPLCALHLSLEERWIDYITGAAMMESDVRIETNSRGFCGKHYDMTLSRRNRLSVALMLQSRLEHLDGLLESDIKSDGKDGKRVSPKLIRRIRGDRPHGGGHAEKDCFVCDRIKVESFRIARNIAALWEKEADFRALYSEQEFICYPHASALMRTAKEELRGDMLGGFLEATAGLTRKKLRAVKADIDAFCGLFDYRSAHAPKPEGEVARAVECAIEYLNGK